MEIINSLLGLSFGGITLSVICLLVLLLVLALLVELGIWSIKLAIAADDPNAPEINLSNIIWEKVIKKLPIKYAVGEMNGKYYAIVCDLFGIRGISKNNYNLWSFKNTIKEYCLYETKQQAEQRAREYYNGRPSVYSLLCLIAPFIMLDVAVFGLINFFLPSVIILSIFTFFKVTRFISKKLYANMKKTDNHEERINKLEEK